MPEGALAALVGPNGAGKTTLMNMAVGLTVPTEGAVTVLGGQPAGASAAFLALGALVWDNLFSHDYPAGAFWPAQCAVAGGLLALAAVLALGTLRLVRRHAA